jgi:glycosyltransferase involved in cell wall biosynthesis
MMKVFVVEFDLYQNIGGGQTAYRRLIETNPDIEFHYLGWNETAEAPRPANARMIPYRFAYRTTFGRKPHDTHPPHWAYSIFVDANNLAASVAGQEFDVVETPDFRQYGSLLRPALVWHGVRFGRISVSMHGALSISRALDWPNPPGINLTLDLQEKLQFRAADTRYGISRDYIEAWSEATGLQTHYLDPMRMLEPPRPVYCKPSRNPPSLYFIGRTEKRKGPDIFMDMVWWLPRKLYSQAAVIGPESITEYGEGSNTYLRGFDAVRSKDVAIMPSMTPSELGELFAGRAMVFLPSRYDTLNLLALESLFAGCPTVIGSSAGVCRFLRESFPQVPFVEMDMRNIYGCLPEVRAVLQDYDNYRWRLVESLEKSAIRVDGPSLAEIYNSPPCPDAGVQKQMDQWHAELSRYYEAESRSLAVQTRWTAIKTARRLVPHKTRKKIVRISSNLRNAISLTRVFLRKRILESKYRWEVAAAMHGLHGRRLARRYKLLMRKSESTRRKLDKKMEKAWPMAGKFRVDRARIWTEIARLERMRGNDLAAVTYELRVMRALGEDRLALLPGVVNTLRLHGFERESLAAAAMYGPPEKREEACAALLHEALAAHAEKPDFQFDRIDDRRQGEGYRVSVIVSLYNAADKLSFFLNALQNQTLFNKRGAEVILVDTGSPGRDYDAFRAAMRSLKMPVVYARSSKRETIQNAWNRGITLSRAPYLAFLGVDEAVLPDALEVLAKELDRDPNLDWVQGSSLVTEVDRLGTWKRDIMIYDRSDYEPVLPYLETCYLTHVGSLYRRSIHDRCGYYDTTFRAAGDTEFKNRALPMIQTKTLPRILGVFWNYPDARTTQSPRAEIEDLRAWYLHRTPAGVEYAFGKRDPQETADLFYKCLSYRKSFCKHLSTDVEYAHNLAGYLSRTSPGMLDERHAEVIRRVLAAYRSLEWLPRLSRWMPARQLLRVVRLLHKAEAEHRALGPPGLEPLYGIFNDNRHEQHTHVWRKAAA